MGFLTGNISSEIIILIYIKMVGIILPIEKALSHRFNGIRLFFSQFSH